MKRSERLIILNPGFVPSVSVAEANIDSADFTRRVVERAANLLDGYGIKNVVIPADKARNVSDRIKVIQQYAGDMPFMFTFAIAADGDGSGFTNAAGIRIVPNGVEEDCALAADKVKLACEEIIGNAVPFAIDDKNPKRVGIDKRNADILDCGVAGVLIDGPYCTNQNDVEYMKSEDGINAIAEMLFRSAFYYHFHCEHEEHPVNAGDENA